MSVWAWSRPTARNATAVNPTANFVVKRKQTPKLMERKDMYGPLVAATISCESQTNWRLRWRWVWLVSELYAAMLSLPRKYQAACSCCSFLYRRERGARTIMRCFVVLTASGAHGPEGHATAVISWAIDLVGQTEVEGSKQYNAAGFWRSAARRAQNRE